MAERLIYFTWPDGGFAYDCAGCGACCRGLGIGFDANTELVPLLGRYPALAAFTRKRGATVTAFNPRDRCWFFDDGGLCRVERDHGRELKPAACRLFPFNRVFRAGDYTVVDYNSVVCPLRVAEAGTGVRHAEIAGDIEAVVDPAVVGTQLAVSESDARSFIDRERAVAAVCFEQARAETIDLDAVWRAFGATEPLAQAQAQVSEATAELTQLSDPSSSPRRDDAASVRTALWLTPSLRFNERFGPRAYGSANTLPRQWLAWLHFVRAGAELAERPLTLQEATSMWAEVMPLAFVIARWHEQPWGNLSAVAPPSDDALGKRVKRLAHACTVNRSVKHSFGQLISSAAGEANVAERVMLVRGFEACLPGLRFDEPAARPGRSKKRDKRRR